MKVQKFAALMLACATLVIGNAMAQPDIERRGASLIAQSGAPDRFVLEPDDQIVRLRDTQSGLICSIPHNAPRMTLVVEGDLLECSYSGGIADSWMVLPASARAVTSMDLRTFIATYAVYQQEEAPTLRPVPRTEQPAPIEALATIYPSVPSPFVLWMRDTRDGVDLWLSIAGADHNGHRFVHVVEGGADAVGALTQLGYYTGMPVGPSAPSVAPPSK
jgi:hypothetical protein